MAGLLPLVTEHPSTKQRRIATHLRQQGDPNARQTDQQTKTRRRARNRQARKTRKRNRR